MMNRIALALAALAFAGPAFANDINRPFVAGWKAGGKNARTAEEYSAEIDRRTTHAGNASAALRSRVDSPTETFYLTQVVGADNYRGKRVRLSGYAKTDLEARPEGKRPASPSGEEETSRPDGLRLWLVILNDDNKSLGSDIMWNRPVVGSTGWTRYDIVIDVPPGATKLSFGASLKGKGAAWVDDLKLETVDLTVALTAEPAFPREPVNLGFEDVTPPAAR
jgi:hypothetical protein